MTVLITGVGHSGTTFFARLLMELGCDFGQGDPPADWTDGAHAMELPAMASLADRILESVGGKKHLPAPPYDVGPDLFQEGARLVPTLPPFIKSPTIGATYEIWHKMGLRVPFLFLITRRMSSVARSLHKAVPDRTVEEWRTRGYGWTGLICLSIFTHKMPYAVCDFGYNIDHPRDLFDILQAIARYCPGLPQPKLVDFMVAFHKVYNPALVHER